MMMGDVNDDDDDENVLQGYIEDEEKRNTIACEFSIMILKL